MKWFDLIWKVLGILVPLWAALFLALVMGILVRAIFRPSQPPPQTQIVYRYVDRPYEVEKEIPVYVPREVVVYAPAIRDTVVQFLVPVGLE